MQYEDAITIEDSHNKEKSVTMDYES